jgi:putative restriction endonuclease
MAHLVLTTKPEPAYDDLPEFRYHFPKTYLNVAKTGVGDLVVYYEPRRDTATLERAWGRQCYFATARLVRIDEDPANPDHFYAYVADYLGFDRPVPFREGGHYYERLLQKPDGSTNKGRFGRAVRAIEPIEYQSILSAAFASPPGPVEAAEEAVEPETVRRPILEVIAHRPFRDVMFRRMVRRAYVGTCAMTGLDMKNGGGALEVEAAHIRPIAGPHSGPDSVRNGIALSRTLHWLFDHGHVSIDDDLRILLARRGIPDKVRSMLNEDGRLRAPKSPENRPHRQFLRYHREHIFKG